MIYPKLVNGGFVVNGGGWVGVGFDLGGGCQVALDTYDTPRLHDPSLTWDKGKLFFADEQDSVVQVVNVPLPATVTFSVFAVGMENQNTMRVDLSDNNEAPTTGDFTGGGNISLSVTTTSPHEKITIKLTGRGRTIRGRRCTGPYFTNAKLMTTLAQPLTISAG